MNGAFPLTVEQFFGKRSILLYNCFVSIHAAPFDHGFMDSFPLEGLTK